LTQYIGIHSEGGLIPYDVLDKIAQEDSGLGQQAKDFGLPAGRRLTDEISRAWSDAQDYWHIFQRRSSTLPLDESGATLTRKWISDLLELIGYELTLQQAGVVIGGKNYPISYRAGASEDSPPVQIEGFRADLDKRPQARRLSPQALVQEYLNNSDSQLWGVVTNGLLLRLLRDTSRTSRPSYLEFNLESILEGNRFNEFALLCRVCHRTRLPQTDEDSTSCWLEKYFQLSIEQGGRVRDRLRDGVEDALKSLGTGFLRHPDNTVLRERAKAGTLGPAEFHRQLLRLVYRLLFLMVAEERRMIVPEGPEADRRQSLYDRYYSVARLRALAEKPIETSTFGDLWIGLQQTFALFEDGDSNPLGVPPLNGDLFSGVAVKDLQATHLYNDVLLAAMQRLSLFEDHRVRQRVNYSALDVEELGSVYESLLDFQPAFHEQPEGITFELRTGSERKSTGSYYTRPELVRELIESALVPVMQDRIAAVKDSDPAKEREKKQHAILSMSVCDPACGSGHFLLAAARRLGRELARIKTEEDEPTPKEFHLAVREVIAHCVYGVDVNPLAVDLCKLALWLEGHWTGKPLSFLDHRIKCGNSLIGVLDPKVLEDGVPDDAFSAVLGDDKEATKSFRNRNREERRGQPSLPFDVVHHVHEYATEYHGLTDIAEDSPAGVRQKADAYQTWRGRKDWWHDWTACNIWTAAFFTPFTKFDDPVVPTHERLLRFVQRHDSQARMAASANALSDPLRFFHWRLEFPEVFDKGGFDVVTGNPPWDTLSPDAKEFFSSYDPEVRTMAPGQQETRISELCENQVIASEWENWCRSLYALVRFLKNSGRYKLFAPGNLGKGDFNVYRMFVESAMALVRYGGYIGQVVPEGLYNGANCMAIRKALFEEFHLSDIHGFENAREIWFNGIDSRTKFCLYTAQSNPHTSDFEVAFNIRTLERLSRVKAGECLRMPIALVSEFSPVALAIMEFDSQTDIDVCRKIYRQWPRFGDVSSGGAVRTYMREVDMGNDRDLFSAENSGIPVYEGRMVSIFDHRAKAYLSGRGRAAEWEELSFSSPNKAVRPQWHIDPSQLPPEVMQRIKRYRVGFCDVASPTNERSLVAALIPPNCVCGHKVPTFTFKEGYEWQYMVWLAVANSFTMDFVVRKKISLTMSYTVLDSLPFPRLCVDDPTARLLVPLSLRLTCVSSEMIDYWNLVAKCGFVEPVDSDSRSPGLIEDNERELSLSTVEAIVASKVFGLSRNELAFIMDTFPIVRRKDEAQFGEYRTRRLVLEAFDRQADSQMEGAPA
jgi:hypothetical protein